MSQKILHKRSSVAAKLPTASQLDYGELAINYANGSETITMKNSANEIISFKSQEYIDDNDLFTKGTGTNSITKKGTSAGTASGQSAFAAGTNVTASGVSSFAEGQYSTASGAYSHAEGYATKATEQSSHAEGESSEASGKYSHAEGVHTKATGLGSHAEGGVQTVSSGGTQTYTTASGSYSHAEGYNTTASGTYSHAEGYQSLTGSSTDTTLGMYSHAEGYGTKAYGQHSHAEGYQTVTGSTEKGELDDGTKFIRGNFSHAEGYQTNSLGSYSHVEGNGTIVNNAGGHAEGYKTVVDSVNGHAEGYYTQTKGPTGSHVHGRANVTSYHSIHSIGIGSVVNDVVTRKNAEDIFFNGQDQTDSRNGRKYLVGLGNYDGTNLDKDGALNTNSYSVQEIINKLIEKAGGLGTLMK